VEDRSGGCDEEWNALPAGPHEISDDVDVREDYCPPELAIPT
jgi:hypothetical protein